MFCHVSYMFSILQVYAHVVSNCDSALWWSHDSGGLKLQLKVQVSVMFLS